jgi:hypothetical protein
MEAKLLPEHFLKSYWDIPEPEILKLKKFANQIE